MGKAKRTIRAGGLLQAPIARPSRTGNRAWKSGLGENAAVKTRQRLKFIGTTNRAAADSRAEKNTEGKGLALNVIAHHALIEAAEALSGFVATRLVEFEAEVSAPILPTAILETYARRFRVFTDAVSANGDVGHDRNGAGSRLARCGVAPLPARAIRDREAAAVARPLRRICTIEIRRTGRFAA